MDQSSAHNVLMNRDAGSVLSKVLLSIVFVVLLVIAALIPYLVMQRKVDNLNIQILNLKTELAKKAPIPEPTSYEFTSPKGVHMTIYYPTPNSKVSSPVGIIGEVPGNWSFEASFPIKLEDGSGRIIAQTNAHLLGDWMTSQPVPFSSQLIFSTSSKGTGKLVLQKDNPSGLPENEDSVSIPVNFG